MERFKGLAILATNRKEDLDDAFLRRLRFVVDFPLPDVAERQRIWAVAIPDGVDASALDFDFLAERFPLAGGHIRSAIFNACLQSAAAGARRRGCRWRRCWSPSSASSTRPSAPSASTSSAYYCAARRAGAARHDASACHVERVHVRVRGGVRRARRRALAAELRSRPVRTRPRRAPSVRRTDLAAHPSRRARRVTAVARAVAARHRGRSSR